MAGSGRNRVVRQPINNGAYVSRTVSTIHLSPTATLALLLLGCLPLVSGCSQLLTSEPPPAFHYLLTDWPRPPTVAVASATARPTLHVQIGTVGTGLASDKVVARDALRLAPIKGLRWAEPASDLLEKTLVRHLELSGRFSYVTSQRGGPPTDLTLVVDLRSLHVRLEDQVPRGVEVAVSARLVDRLQKQPVGIVQLTENETLASSDPSAIMQAFQTAFARLLTRLDAGLAAALDARAAASS